MKGSIPRHWELWVFAIAVGLLPLQWIKLGPGPLARVTLSDLGIAMLGMSMAQRFLRRAWRIDRRLDRWAILLIGTTFLAVVVNAANFVTSSQFEVGRGFLLRDFVCGLLVWMLYAGLREFDCRQVMHYLSLGISLGAVLFIAGVFYTAAQRGKNVVKIYAHAVITADPNYVQMTLYRDLFSEPGDSSESDEDAHGRHTIFLLLCLGAIATWLNTHPSWTQRRPQKWQWLMIGTFVFLVLASLSRQSTLVLVIFLVCAALGSRSKMLPLAVFLLALAGLFVALYPPVADLIRAKFFEDVVENPRVAQFERTMREILSSPWFGNGAGVRVAGDFFPHNLILHGWHQAGVLGLLGSSLCVFSLIFYLGTHVRLLLRRIETISVPAIAIVAIGSITLIRLSVGVRGSLEIASILSLAITLLLGRDLSWRQCSELMNKPSA
ncbi:MAG: O-antigen ligase family protein [Planctomycetaceae bacterium]